MTFLLSPQFRRDVEKLPSSARKRVKEALFKLRDEGCGDIKKVGERLWRLRVGDYRVYYSPSDEDTYVLRVVHRRHAYRPETIRTLLRRVAAFEGRVDGESNP